MQKCSSCGADLLENSRFCGKRGNVQDTVATDAAATIVNTPRPQSWTPEGGAVTASWSANVQEPVTPPPPVTENEDEQRRGILPWSPLYGAALAADALLDGGQPYTGGAPVVQGTPQTGSVSSVASSPTSYTNAPVTHPAQGPVNAPVTHPVQSPGSASISHPVQGPTNAPVGRPIQEPPKAPHPQPKPQPIHQPPEQPGKPEPPPTHKHHRHHKHPEEHEHHQHQAHTRRHESHRVARVTRATGSSSVKTIILVVVAVAVVAAGGIVAAVHFLSGSQTPLSHSQPLISITSNYKVGNAPAGATGTTLHISGQQFASNSAITFLLDGQVAPGNPGAQSDSNGNFSADITITSAWSVGTHTLTAKDASNNSTKNSVSVTIVQPGQANTPGPNGAPPDDATFTVTFTEQAPGLVTRTETMLIAGHPDGATATACLDRDDGQQHNLPRGTTRTYIETDTFSCKGSYKGGKISYDETVLTDVVAYTDGSGVKCTLLSPQPHEQVTGSYTGNGTFTGIFTFDYTPASDFSCTDGEPFSYVNTTGTWTGTVSGLQG